MKYSCDHHRAGIIFPDAATLTVSSGGAPGHQRWSHMCSEGEYEYITTPLARFGLYLGGNGLQVLTHSGRFCMRVVDMALQSAPR